MKTLLINLTEPATLPLWLFMIADLLAAAYSLPV
jgi:hypothetical protein